MWHVMPSTDRKLELKAKTSVAQTSSQPYVYAKGLNLPVSLIKLFFMVKSIEDYSPQAPNCQGV
jgi:hypothetical protein